MDTLKLPLGLVACFMIVVFTALRLARFNQEVRDSHYFYGLNAPTNAIFFFGLYMSWLSNSFDLVDTFYLNWILMLIIVSISCFLLVSEIKMLSSKNLKNKTTRNIVIALMVITLIGLYVIGPIAISISVLLYVLLSIFLLNIKPNKS